MASTVGDFDNDGRPDLFVTRWRSYALYRNRGDGTFEDITDRAGLGGDRDWPTSAAFADLDNDGDLDLYVCHYLVWDAEHPHLCKHPTKPGEPIDPNHIYEYCMPNPFPSRPDHLFRNDGGRFVDVTAEAGIVDPNGRGLGVVAADVDEDGLIDLFVANDTTANYLWHNLGGMKFEEVGVSSGVACNAQGSFQAGMGTAVGDLDGDGLPDLTGHELLRRVDVLLQEHGQGHVRRPDLGDRPGRSQPVPGRLRHRPVRRQQRRPTRPGSDERPRDRQSARFPPRDAGAALDRRGPGTPGRRHLPSRSGLERPADRPRPGRGRPRQRRPHRPGHGAAEGPARLLPQPDARAQPATPSRSSWRGPGPTAMAWGRSSRSRPAAVAVAPGVTGAAAISRPPTRASISAWDRTASKRSRSAGPRVRSTASRMSNPTAATGCGREKAYGHPARLFARRRTGNGPGWSRTNRLSDLPESDAPRGSCRGPEAVRPLAGKSRSRKVCPGASGGHQPLAPRPDRALTPPARPVRDRLRASKIATGLRRSPHPEGGNLRTSVAIFEAWTTAMHAIDRASSTGRRSGIAADRLAGRERLQARAVLERSAGVLRRATPLVAPRVSPSARPTTAPFSPRRGVPKGG